MRHLDLKPLKTPSDVPFKISNGGGIVKSFEQESWNQLLACDDLWAIEIGSITRSWRQGNSGNTYQFPLNSLGMPNPGFDGYYQKYLPDAVKQAHDAGKYIIANIAGFTIDEYVELAEMTLKSEVDVIVFNGGCPNIITDDGGRKPLMSLSKDRTRELIARVHSKCGTGNNFLYKVSPYSDPDLLKEIAGVIRSFPGVFQGVVAINTFSNGWDCDPHTGKSTLSVPGGYGGVSNLLHIALGQVKQWREELPDHVIVGVGGITKGEDVMKFKHAGADYFQITTAILEKGVGVVPEILADAYNFI